MQTLKLIKNRTGAIWALVLSLGLILAGCGGDDNPTDPGGGGGGGGGGSTTQFDENFATQQSEFLVTTIIEQMASVPIYANGVPNKADDIYSWGWVDDPGRWEGSYSGSYEGFTSTWNLWLQYTNAVGAPQQEPLGAAAMAYHIDANMSGSETGEGYSYDLGFDYVQNYSVSGLGSDTLLIGGDGSTDIDYSYTSDGSSSSASYSMTWRTLGPGISYPIDGCPTGSMEFTMAPFVVTVVFDGSDTAAYTMRNGSTVIPGGSGNTYLDCSGFVSGSSE